MTVEVAGSISTVVCQGDEYENWRGRGMRRINSSVALVREVWDRMYQVLMPIREVK
jgi:hypothetical protein